MAASNTPIQINFPNHSPVGLDLHDIIYYVDTSEEEHVRMGPVSSIVNNESTNVYYIIVDASYGVAPPDTEDFIYYKKNPIGYVSSLKGYFAEAQFINTQAKYAELFSVGAEVFESSK
tara:strand:- start:28 stop:381 length:354 start_codon:yes stop_codon:yes gene_type:complete